MSAVEGYSEEMALPILLHLFGLLLQHQLQVGLSAVPRDLSNFQNEYVCDTATLIVRPASITDVQSAVRTHTQVKGVAAGRSWNGVRGGCGGGAGGSAIVVGFVKVRSEGWLQRCPGCVLTRLDRKPGEGSRVEPSAHTLGLSAR